MAVKAASGSGNLVNVYTTTGTGLDTLVFTFDKNTTENFTGDVATDDLAIELESIIDNPAFLTFKETFAVSGEVTSETITYTDASEDKNVTIPADATDLIAIHQGGVISGQRKLTGFQTLVGVQQTSKSANTTSGYTVTLTAVPAATDYVLSSVVIDADFNVTGSSDLSISQDSYGKEVFVTNG